MLGFDIQKINKQFLSILGDLILTAEERYILESLSIGKFANHPRIQKHFYHFIRK